MHNSQFANESLRTDDGKTDLQQDNYIDSKDSSMQHEIIPVYNVSMCSKPHQPRTSDLEVSKNHQPLRQRRAI